MSWSRRRRQHGLGPGRGLRAPQAERGAPGPARPVTELPPAPGRTGLEADAPEGFGPAPCSALARRRPRGLPAGRAEPAPGPCPREGQGAREPTLPTINPLTGDRLRARCHGSLGLNPPEGGFSAFCSLSSHSEASSHASCPTDTRRGSLYSIHVYENAFPTPVHNKLLPDPAGPPGAEGGCGAGGVGPRLGQAGASSGRLSSFQPPSTETPRSCPPAEGLGTAGRPLGTGLHRARGSPAAGTAEGSAGSAGLALPARGSRHLDEVVHGVILGQPATGERSSREPSATGTPWQRRGTRLCPLPCARGRRRRSRPC